MAARVHNRLKLNQQADLVQDLFADVVNGRNALAGRAARKLGIQSIEHLRGVIIDPVYRGTNPLGKEEHSWEAYRLVSDDVWHAAVQAVSPRHRDPSIPAAQHEALRDQAGLVRWVTGLVDTGRLPCRTCASPLGWNGYVTIANVVVPQLICPQKHSEKWIDLDSAQAGLSRRACFGCNNDDQRRFIQWRDGPFWRAKCKVCGWNTGRLPCPAFAPLREPAVARRLYLPSRHAQGSRAESPIQQDSRSEDGGGMRDESGPSP